MKHDTKQAVENAVLAITGTVSTVALQNVSLFVSILVGLATLSFIGVQFFFLIRKWYLLETHDWKNIPTTPGALDEHKAREDRRP